MCTGQLILGASQILLAHAGIFLSLNKTRLGFSPAFLFQLQFLLQTGEAPAETWEGKNALITIN